jgi:hypothetical protein
VVARKTCQNLFVGQLLNFVSLAQREGHILRFALPPSEHANTSMEFLIADCIGKW